MPFRYQISRFVVVDGVRLQHMFQPSSCSNGGHHVSHSCDSKWDHVP